MTNTFRLWNPVNTLILIYVLHRRKSAYQRQFQILKIVSDKKKFQLIPRIIQPHLKFATKMKFNENQSPTVSMNFKMTIISRP